MDEVSQVREKIDLVSYISEFIALKKAGRNFRAVCPFHNEKTASFMVSPERQIWHCFGCGKGGDVFTFLMEYENMEFAESLRTLAKKAGVELKQSDFKKNVTSEKENIYEINKIALKFYKYILTKHNAGKKALEYLTEKRGLNTATIENFELGFAPTSPKALSEYLTKKKNYKAKELVLAGVSIDKNGTLFDFFRARLMFPLFDHRGNVLGFSGRALNEFDMPKYINTKDTIAYHKGSVFFGLNLAKEEIKQKQNAILVEGEFDMISLFKSGVKNAIAIKGTALTNDQVALISRFTPKVTFCFDQDSAGFEATKRSLSIIEKRGLSAEIINLGQAKDPDEALKNDSSFFKKTLSKSLNIYDYLTDFYISQNSKTTMEGKKKITDELLPLLSQISNEIVKEHYIKKLSKELDISLESLNKEIDKLQKTKEEDKIIAPEKKARNRRELLEEYLLSLIIQSSNPKELLLDYKKMISDYKFKTLSLQKISYALFEFFEKNNVWDTKTFSNYLSTELVKSFDFLYLYPLYKFADDEKYKEELKDVSKELLIVYAKERLKEISEKLKLKNGKEDEKEELKKEFTRLLSLLKQ